MILDGAMCFLASEHVNVCITVQDFGAGFLQVMAENWKNLKNTYTFLSFYVLEWRYILANKINRLEH